MQDLSDLSGGWPNTHYLIHLTLLKGLCLPISTALLKVLKNKKGLLILYMQHFPRTDMKV